MSSSVENSGSLLLDEEDGITEQFELCLAHIFAKYCKPKPSPPSSSPSTTGTHLLSPPEGAYLTAEGLDEWARDTNGAVLSDEEKEEILEYMDVTDDGCLTFKGFMQLYALQTQNDEAETWKDLGKHGFDRALRLSE